MAPSLASVPFPSALPWASKQYIMQRAKTSLRLLYCGVLLCGLLTPFGCNDALEEDPETFYNAEQIFSTEEGLESAVNGIYSQLFDGGYYGTSVHGLIMPVSGKFWSSQNVNVDATSLNTASSNNWLSRLWPNMYQAINSANVVIDQLENGDLGLENEATSLGQAHFVRGMVYFDLARLFGGVPLRLKPTTLDELHLPRAERQAVYAQAIADLEKAVDLLPIPGEYRPERPTVFTAKAYLARVFLDIGSRNDDRQSYQRAFDLALDVHENGPYTLTPTYAELFVPGNENTVESIFELQYAQTGGLRNSDVVRFYSLKESTLVPENVTVFARIRPNKETFDDHAAQYPGDPRIDATFFYNEYEKTDGSIRTIYPVRTNWADGYAGIAKYGDPTYNGTTTDRNMIHFRYADLLLMLAEAENYLNGPENAYQYVNQVLARARDLDGDGSADTEQPMDYADMDQESFSLRIRKERQCELLAEGHAWFDTRRFGYDYFLDEVVRKHNSHPEFDDNKDFVYPEDEKNMLLPLPLIELSGNQAIGASEQNPGY